MKIIKKILLDVILIILLFLISLSIGTTIKMQNPECVTCGANIASTIWISTVIALQPVIWATGIIKFHRFIIWFVAVFVGGILYTAGELFGSYLLTAGQSIGLKTGFLSNTLFYAVSLIISLFGIHYIKKKQSPSEKQINKLKIAIWVISILIASLCAVFVFEKTEVDTSYYNLRVEKDVERHTRLFLADLIKSHYGESLDTIYKHYSNNKGIITAEINMVKKGRHIAKKEKRFVELFGHRYDENNPLDKLEWQNLSEHDRNPSSIDYAQYMPSFLSEHLGMEKGFVEYLTEYKFKDFPVRDVNHTYYNFREKERQRVFGEDIEKEKVRQYILTAAVFFGMLSVTFLLLKFFGFAIEKVRSKKGNAFQ